MFLNLQIIRDRLLGKDNPGVYDVTQVLKRARNTGGAVKPMYV